MSSWTSKIRTPAIALAGILLLAGNAMAAVVFTVDSIADQIDVETSDGLCHTAANTCNPVRREQRGYPRSGACDVGAFEFGGILSTDSSRTYQ